MGGNYFINAANPLKTPRMGQMVYFVMKNRIMDLLKKHFLRVECPLEAPEKESFGDIDVVVQAPVSARSHTNKEVYELLLEILKPERLHTEGSNSKTDGDLMYHAAIAWPEDVPEEPAGAPKSGERAEKLYIQLDIRVCKTAHSLGWNLFRHAHGDIWSMIGSSIRPYGLTVDEEALYIRIPEIEAYDRKRSRIALTAEPDEILDFLGLDSVVYWGKPFRTIEELCEYVSKCPMFVAFPGDTKMDPASFKSSDRKRINQRPIYRRWVEKYMPECRKAGRFLEPRTTPEEIKTKALARFNAAEEYEARRKAYLLEKQKEKIWTTMIKGTPPPPEFGGDVMYRSCCWKALKRIILEGSEEFVEGPLDLKYEDGFYDENKVRRFLEEHADAVGRRAYEAHQAAFHAKKAKTVSEA